MAVVLVDAEGPAPHGRTLVLAPTAPFRRLIGVGGIGTGLFFALDGEHTLGRNESRSGRLLDVRDYCKLHIITHYVAVLLGAHPSGSPFHVLPIGKVGDDEIGGRLIEEMRAVGIDLRWVYRHDDRRTLTSVCFQYSDGSGGNITARDSAADSLTAADVDLAVPVMRSAPGRSIALAVPEVPLGVRDHLLTRATETGALRVASFTPSEIGPARTAGMFSRVDILALNEDEAAILAGESFDYRRPGPFLQSCATVLRRSQPGLRVVVTAGAHGAYACDGGSWVHCPAPTVGVVGSAGAGDALLAGIIAALAVGMPFVAPAEGSGAWQLASALDLGVLLAAYSVTSPHTIHDGANLSSLLSFASNVGMDVPASAERYISLPDADVGGRHDGTTGRPASLPLGRFQTSGQV